jgi:hypothetical protein
MQSANHKIHEYRQDRINSMDRKTDARILQWILQYKQKDAKTDEGLGKYEMSTWNQKSLDCLYNEVKKKEGGGRRRDENIQILGFRLKHN